MKKQSNNLLQEISAEHMVNITTVVKETIATDCCCQQQCKRFTAADLWNIQRHGKGRIQRRMF